VARLLVWSPSPLAREVPLGEAAIEIGRAREAEVALEAVGLSRRHARLEPVAVGGYRLVDLGSANGTWVNGRRLTGALELRHGDRLQLGPVSLHFEDPAHPPAVSPGPAPTERDELVHLHGELEQAREVQRAFLPDELPSLPGYRLASRYRPAGAVGGDLFAVGRTADGCLALALGDVAGKGVGAALAMARLIGPLRRRLVTGEPPGAVLEGLSRELAGELGEGVFVTLQAALLDPTSGRLELASAGHLPALLRAADGQVRRVGPPGGPPVASTAEIACPTARLELPPGACLLLLSDGVTEAQRAQGELFGWSRLERALAAAEGTAAGVVAAVLAAVADFEAGGGAADDLCLLALDRHER
jgi:hypothetical protein